MLLLRLTIADLKMIYRNRQSLFWALAFPLIFVVVFGIFTPDSVPTTTIVVIDNSQDEVSTELISSLDLLDTIEMERRQNEDQAREELEDGDLGFLMVIPEGFAEKMSQNPPAIVELRYDDSSPFAGVIISVIERFLDPHIGTMRPYPDVDGFNDRMAGEKCSLDLTTIMRDLDETHTRLLELLEKLPDSAFHQEKVEWRLRLDTYEHYPEHAETLRDWLG